MWLYAPGSVTTEPTPNAGALARSKDKTRVPARAGVELRGGTPGSWCLLLMGAGLGGLPLILGLQLFAAAFHVNHGDEIP